MYRIERHSDLGWARVVQQNFATKGAAELHIANKLGGRWGQDGEARSPNGWHYRVVPCT